MPSATPSKEGPSTDWVQKFLFYNVYHVLDERNYINNSPLTNHRHRAFSAVIEDFENSSDRLLKVGGRDSSTEQRKWVSRFELLPGGLPKQKWVSQIYFLLTISKQLTYHHIIHA